MEKARGRVPACKLLKVFEKGKADSLGGVCGELWRRVICDARPIKINHAPRSHQCSKKRGSRNFKDEGCEAKSWSRRSGFTVTGKAGGRAGF